jgi:hypothetical protein
MKQSSPTNLGTPPITKAAGQRIERCTPHRQSDVIPRLTKLWPENPSRPLARSVGFEPTALVAPTETHVLRTGSQSFFLFVERPTKFWPENAACAASTVLPLHHETLRIRRELNPHQWIPMYSGPAVGRVCSCDKCPTKVAREQGIASPAVRTETGRPIPAVDWQRHLRETAGLPFASSVARVHYLRTAIDVLPGGSWAVHPVTGHFGRDR